MNGHKMLLVVDLEVTRLVPGAKLLVSCDGCQPFLGRIRETRTATTRSFRGVDWLLASGRAISAAVTMRSAVGRFLVLVSNPQRRRLVFRSAGCLGASDRHERCPSGVKSPRPGTPATSTLPQTTTTTTTQTQTQTQTTATQTTTTAAGAVTFDANFDSGSVAPFAAQCAPQTPSSSQRLRGVYAFDGSVVGQGTASVKFTLPTDTNLATYPLEACDLETPLAPIGLGTDSYIGVMIYVPVGWTIPNEAFYGVNVYELHFQNIYGAPVTLQLHPDHVTLALETGGCNSYLTSNPGCQWRGNADVPSLRSGAGYTALPGNYAIPPGAFVQGKWNEIVLHVYWSTTTTGQIQSYYRVKGGSTWTQSSNISGIPTVQWNNTEGCCNPTYIDELEAYTQGVSAPMSIWVDNAVDGTSLAAVEATMP